MCDLPWGSRVGPCRHSAPDLAGPSPLVQPEHRGSAPRALWPLPASPAPRSALLTWSSARSECSGGVRVAVVPSLGTKPCSLSSSSLGPWFQAEGRTGSVHGGTCGRGGWQAGRQAGGAASVEASRGRFLKGGGGAAQAKAWPHVSPGERAVGRPWSPLWGAGGRCTLRKPHPIHPGPRRPSELVTTPMARPRRTSLVWGAGAGSGGGEPSWGTPRSHSAPLATSRADLA